MAARTSKKEPARKSKPTGKKSTRKATGKKAGKQAGKKAAARSSARKASSRKSAAAKPAKATKKAAASRAPRTARKPVPPGSGELVHTRMVGIAKRLVEVVPSSGTGAAADSASGGISHTNPARQLMLKRLLG